ncbi:MAG: hypothetical protein HQK96_10240 [Nitrospirae bacterium]|nr:hypothetical protein [Nitrospirota bacterium]
MTELDTQQQGEILNKVKKKIKPQEQPKDRANEISKTIADLRKFTDVQETGNEEANSLNRLREEAFEKAVAETAKEYAKSGVTPETIKSWIFGVNEKTIANYTLNTKTLAGMDHVKKELGFDTEKVLSQYQSFAESELKLGAGNTLQSDKHQKLMGNVNKIIALTMEDCIQEVEEIKQKSGGKFTDENARSDKWIVNSRLQEKLKPINEAVLPSAKLYVRMHDPQFKDSVAKVYGQGFGESRIDFINKKMAAIEQGLVKTNVERTVDPIADAGGLETKSIARQYAIPSGILGNTGLLSKINHDVVHGIADPTRRDDEGKSRSLDDEITQGMDRNKKIAGLNNITFLNEKDQEIQSNGDAWYMAACLIQMVPYVGAVASIPTDAETAFGRDGIMANLQRLHSSEAIKVALDAYGLKPIPPEYKVDVTGVDRAMAIVSILLTVFALQGAAKAVQMRKLEEAIHGIKPGILEKMFAFLAKKMGVPEEKTAKIRQFLRGREEAAKTEGNVGIRVGTVSEVSHGAREVKKETRALHAETEISKLEKLTQPQQEELAQKLDKPSWEELSKMPQQDLEALARKNWKKLSQEEQLHFCDPSQIRKEMQESLKLPDGLPTTKKFAEGELFSKNIEHINNNINTRLDNLTKAEHITQQYADTIKKSAGQYVDLIAKAQTEGSLSKELRAGEISSIAEDIVLKMVYQQKESLKRALGDHGVRHIIDGNITESFKMMAEYDNTHPDKPLTAIDRLKMMTIHYNHDMGYTASINRKGFESTGDHRFFSENIFGKDDSLYNKLFKDEDIAQIKEAIKTHDQADIDFSNKAKALESIIRLSDNLGLFHDIKLPEIFYNNSKNVEILQRIYIARRSGQDIKGLIEELKTNIHTQSGLDSNTRKALLNAAAEVVSNAPEFNLGMFAGKLESYRMEDGTMIVSLKESDMHKQIQELFKLGQRQFEKLLESYGVNLKDKKGLENFVKTDSKRGITYIDIPPDGSGRKQLRFEFHKGDATPDPTTEQFRRIFSETDRKWKEINIRETRNSLVEELENVENRPKENITALVDTFTKTINNKCSSQDLREIADIRKKLLSSDKFEEGFNRLKSFFTAQENKFLSRMPTQ